MDNVSTSTWSVRAYGGVDPNCAQGCTSFQKDATTWREEPKAETIPKMHREIHSMRGLSVSTHRFQFPSHSHFRLSMSWAVRDDLPDAVLADAMRGSQAALCGTARFKASDSMSCSGGSRLGPIALFAQWREAEAHVCVVCRYDAYELVAIVQSCSAFSDEPNHLHSVVEHGGDASVPSVLLGSCWYCSAWSVTSY